MSLQAEVCGLKARLHKQGDTIDTTAVLTKRLLELEGEIRNEKKRADEAQDTLKEERAIW